MRVCQNCLKVIEKLDSSDEEDADDYANESMELSEPAQSDTQSNLKVPSLSDNEDEEVIIYKRHRSGTNASIEPPPSKSSVMRIAQRKKSFSMSHKITSDLNKASINHARAFIKQSLANVGVEKNQKKWIKAILVTLLECASNLDLDIKGGDNIDIRNYVKIKRILGGSPLHSKYVDGIVFSQSLALKSMPRTIDNPKILVANALFENPRHHVSRLAEIAKQESSRSDTIIQRVAQLQPHIIVSTGYISRSIVKRLDQMGIAVVSDVKPSVIDRLARYTQAMIATYETLSSTTRLGECMKFEVKTYRHDDIAKRFLHFYGIPKPLGCTIVLRGGDMEELANVKFVVEFMIYVVFNLKLESALLQDLYVSVPSKPPQAQPIVISKPDDSNNGDDAVKYETDSILSASPFVQFEHPYLLKLARASEDKLVAMDEESEVEKIQLQLKDILSVFGEDYIHKTAESLFAKRYQQLYDLWSSQKRQWESSIYPTMFQPSSHQKIILLYTVISTETDTPCLGPDLITINFYDQTDVTLGQFIENVCLTSNSPCADGCGKIMKEHTRNYAHGNGIVVVTVGDLPCTLPGMQDSILMWSTCNICNTSTPILPMSDSTWKYSVGKYLELIFWSTKMNIKNKSICNHDRFKDYTQYFGWHNLSVKFEYKTISLYTICVPSQQVEWDPDREMKNKITAYYSIQAQINNYFQSVISRIHSIKIDGLAIEKTEECQHRVLELLSRAEKEKEYLNGELDKTCRETEPTSYLELNKVLKEVQEYVVDWDYEFHDFEKHFFPSEKDITRITSQHLKKIFDIDEKRSNYPPTIDTAYNTPEEEKKVEIGAEKETKGSNSAEDESSDSPDVSNNSSQFEKQKISKPESESNLDSQKSGDKSSNLANGKSDDIDKSTDKLCGSGTSKSSNSSELKKEASEEPKLTETPEIEKNNKTSEQEPKSLQVNDKKEKSNKVEGQSESSDLMEKVSSSSKREKRIKSEDSSKSTDSSVTTSFSTSASEEQAKMRPAAMSRTSSAVSDVKRKPDEQTRSSNARKLNKATKPSDSITRQTKTDKPRKTSGTKGDTDKQTELNTSNDKQSNEAKLRMATTSDVSLSTRARSKVDVRSSDDGSPMVKSDSQKSSSSSLSLRNNSATDLRPPSLIAQNSTSSLADRKNKNADQNPKSSETVSVSPERPFFDGRRSPILPKGAMSPKRSETVQGLISRVESSGDVSNNQLRTNSKHERTNSEMSFSEAFYDYKSDAAKEIIKNRLISPNLKPFNFEFKSGSGSPEKGSVLDNARQKLAQFKPIDDTFPRWKIPSSSKIAPTPRPRFGHRELEHHLKYGKFGSNSTLGARGSVSLITNHFEQLSRDFAKERAREIQMRASMPRATPAAHSKPIVEVFETVTDAIEEPEFSDEEDKEENVLENEGKDGDDSSPEPRSGDTENSQKLDDDEQYMDNESNAVDPSISNQTKDDEETSPLERVESHVNQPTVSVSIPTKEAIPQTERQSLLQSLASFWADRSATGWKPLEYPLSPSEHIFVDSNVIMREDEPSSVISFCLSSPHYVEKLRSLRTPENEDQDNLDMEHSKQLESHLMKNTGTHLRYQFQEGTAKFGCKIFYAEQFDALRQQCRCNDAYIQSLSRCVKWDSSGGKSGSAFLKTLDDRLVVKQLSPAELDAFLKFAPSYFKFMAEAFFHNLPTVLSKIFGFYQIQIKNPATNKSMKMDVLVMENLFYNRKTSRIFDLKGSMRNRHVEQTGRENEVLLDENMVEFIYGSPLFVPGHSKRLLSQSVWNDTLFLSKMNVMDYSLVVAIDPEKHELVVGIIDFIRTFTWDKKLESWVKERSLVGGGIKEPTVVSPRQYKFRFREAMERYVLLVPDCWTQDENS